MTSGRPELKCEWKFSIIEGKKKYKLTAKLFKSRLDIEDEDGNKIAVDKREKKIRIQKWGDVDWHR
ncbi:MAG: hypothetical protein OEZ35_02230 [Candidatus Bathyarchaeota archaeon]|nr:hypothetical protein [Candidatus Bathyarchaeota archaeon]